LICALLAAGLVAVAQATSASAEAQPESVSTAFAADSRDSCKYGETSGVLGWRLPPLGGAAVAVDVTGTVVDRPVIGVPFRCGDDGRFSIATVTAFAGSAAVDSERVTADNGTRRFAFQLAAGERATVIDRVVVQVCRSARTPAVDYCGPEQVYRSPVA
jgi:hypothetical protein